LFVDLDKVGKLHAMQLGLGAASLTKFSFKHLRMKTTAIELNPQVVAACRLWFKLPADSAKLQVVLGDAAEVAKHDHWRGQIDALQVDLYDHEAASPVLDSAEFYADCRSYLAAAPALRRAWRRWRRLLGLMRCGLSSLRAKATPWCWRSVHPAPRSALN
jgi:spermidine synthase